MCCLRRFNLRAGSRDDVIWLLSPLHVAVLLPRACKSRKTTCSSRFGSSLFEHLHVSRRVTGFTLVPQLYSFDKSKASNAAERCPRGTPRQQQGNIVVGICFFVLHTVQAYFLGIQVQVKTAAPGQEPANPGWIYTMGLHA